MAVVVDVPAIGEGRGGAVALFPGVGPAFQFHGGLGLEALAGEQAQQAGGGVEQPAQAGGGRAVEVLAQHLGDHGGALLIRVAMGDESFDVAVAAQGVEGGGSQAPGFPGGPVAAGQRQG